MPNAQRLSAYFFLLLLAITLLFLEYTANTSVVDQSAVTTRYQGTPTLPGR
ncbi:MAG: hypothetical protein WA952_02675 [Lewinella sp.]